MKIDIFGVNLDGNSKSQVKDKLEGYLIGDKKVKISKINTEFLHRALNDKKFQEVLNKSDMKIVDGRGVAWSARYLSLPTSSNKIIRFFQSIWQFVYSILAIIFWPKYIENPIKETIPGVIAFYMMMRIASDARAGVFLFGSSQKTLDLAYENIKKDFPKLKISGILNGYDFQKDSKIDVIKEINNTDAKILIVALGSPKQEYWIDDNIDKLKNIKIAVGEGGTLDRIAYPHQKSPSFINRIGLEWLWRLLFNSSKTQSRNRFVRAWNSVPRFIYQTVRWKVLNGQIEVED